MNKESMMSIIASEFLNAIGASNADFKENKIGSINIEMPTTGGAI
jgi:hypothetical protein